MAITPRRSERAKRSMSGQWTSTTHGPREKVPLPKELARCGQPYMNFNPRRSFLFGAGGRNLTNHEFGAPSSNRRWPHPSSGCIYSHGYPDSQPIQFRGGIAMEPNYMSPEEGPRQSANRVQETLYRDLLLYRWPKHLRLQLRQVPRIQNQSPFQPQNGPTPSADSWPSGRKKATATRSPPNSRLPMI